MNCPIVSIIIPVYNTEQYLKKCLDTVINQTYRELEILLIDDGSTDKSPSICDEYAKKDSRVHVVHCKNGGVSRARNTGLSLAKGEYICFVDSDDWLPQNALNDLVSYFCDDKTDLVIGSMQSVGAGINSRQILEDKLIANGSSDWTAFLGSLFGGPVAKLYKKEIIGRHGLSFEHDMRYGEDTVFLLQYLFYCRFIRLSRKKVYIVNRLNENSAVTKYYPELNLWIRRTVEEYCKLVDADAAAKFAEKQFNAICNHYIAHLSKEEALVKISESYEIMREYLPSDSVLYSSLNESDGIEKTYDLLFVNKVTSKGFLMKGFIRKAAIKVKSFWYYH